MTPESLDRYSRGSSAGRALRTLRTGEVLDEALRTYRYLSPMLLRRSAVPAVFVLASVLFWTRAFLPRLFTTTSPGDVSAQIAEAAFVLAIGLLVAGPLLVFGVSEATLQAVALVTAYREGHAIDEASTAASARVAFPRTFGAGLWALFVAGSVPATGFVMMAVGGLLADGSDAGGVVALMGVFVLLLGLLFSLWAAGAYALIPAATLRGDGVRQACRRSRDLLKGTDRIPSGYGTVWGIYGVLLLAALAEWAGLALAVRYVPFASIAPGGGLFAEALSLTVPFIVAWTLLPFWGTAVAVIDAERRVRKEGYDVELLARG